MAVAVSAIRRDATALKRVFCTLTFSGTYTTGGEAPTVGWLKALSLSSLLKANIDQGGNGASDGVIAKYNHSTNKIQLYEGGAAVDSPMKELTSAQAIALVLQAEFIGDGN